MTAEKILFPGPMPCLESLALHGYSAASVAAGAVTLFFIAGILEGWFRQLINNTPGRCAFALATAALWLYYFVFFNKLGAEPLELRSPADLICSLHPSRVWMQ